MITDKRITRFLLVIDLLFPLPFVLSMPDVTFVAWLIYAALTGLILIWSFFPNNPHKRLLAKEFTYQFADFARRVLLSVMVLSYLDPFQDEGITVLHCLWFMLLVPWIFLNAYATASSFLEKYLDDARVDSGADGDPHIFQSEEDIHLPTHRKEPSPYWKNRYGQPSVDGGSVGGASEGFSGGTSGAFRGGLRGTLGKIGRAHV